MDLIQNEQTKQKAAQFDKMVEAAKVQQAQKEAEARGRVGAISDIANQMAQAKEGMAFRSAQDAAAMPTEEERAIFEQAGIPLEAITPENLQYLREQRAAPKQRVLPTDEPAPGMLGGSVLEGNSSLAERYGRNR